MDVYSSVLVVSAAYLTKANALAEAMGWGKGNYTVELSADGKAPATHYGLHAWTTPEFVAMLTQAGKGDMPAGLKAAGFPTRDFNSIMANLTLSVRFGSNGPAAHFNDTVTSLGLTVIPRTPG